LRGNDLIRLFAQVANEAVGAKGTGNEFVGHIGGDDFVIITRPERVDDLCAYLIAQWDTESRKYYTEEDLLRGKLVAIDRQQQLQEYPLVAVSIGVVSNRVRPVRSIEEVSNIAAEVKRKAKATPGSSYYIDQRTQ